MNDKLLTKQLRVSVIKVEIAEKIGTCFNKF